MEIVKIEKIEAATSQAGRNYHKVFFTNGKNATCFEKDIISKLVPGKSYEVEIQEKNGFFNLRKLGEEVAEKATGSVQDARSEPGQYRKPVQIEAASLLDASVKLMDGMTKVDMKEEEFNAMFKSVAEQVLIRYNGFINALENPSE